jgi:hypothetical protein
VRDVGGRGGGDDSIRDHNNAGPARRAQPRTGRYGSPQDRAEPGGSTGKAFPHLLGPGRQHGRVHGPMLPAGSTRYQAEPHSSDQGQCKGSGVIVNMCCLATADQQHRTNRCLTSRNVRDSGVDNKRCPKLVRTSSTSSRARAARAVRLAARIILGALSRTGIGRELSGPIWRAGDPPWGSRRCRSARSALGRRRPRRAVGTRDHGHRPYQLATVTPTIRGARNPPHPPTSYREAARFTASGQSRLSIPGASHCLSPPEPVKGACGGPSGSP